MKFVDKRATLTKDEIEKILDEAFKAVADKIVKTREAQQ